ncbi:type II toxin-antitoxin system HicB family antitoxin [Dyadobacter psychrotolerans]|uniref:Type II toxin-antitoxin system HicB family antitoxin n=1 Tax=Dyadobacter psychrotolerans TaxID=2541721 RepID=A0A4R5DMR9_9BACT|nr:type II toxin-antitoxin system HicB family antitoxin [Dyadobacter psychrotolerans]TDE14817.1 type II toxin-antitoxin system HicB family antitoxin [Dyadobacter psychrotolerans]
MSKYEVIIYWSNEDECFIAEVPELKTIMTHGNTQTEALQNAQEVIELWLQVAKEEGREIPEPKGKLMYA